MKATRAEDDNNKQAHEYKRGSTNLAGQAQNFLHKNKKLVPNWSGPFLITKVIDNGNIRIQFDKKEINSM